MNGHLEFVRDGTYPHLKTSIHHVYSAHDGSYLGDIKWRSGWRRYIFAPNNSHEVVTVFDASCLEEIANFLKAEMALRNVKPAGE